MLAAAASLALLVSPARPASTQNAFDHFSPQPSSHSYPNAYLLAVLSQYVYGAAAGQSWSAFQTEFKNRFTPWGVQEFDFIRNSSNGTEGVVVTTKNAVIVVFRGTETKYVRSLPAVKQEDWVTDIGRNMTTVSSWGTNVRIHAGFQNAMTSVYQSVRNAVLNRAVGGRTVWLTGHSLGAALSTLTAFRLQKLGGVQVKGVYTFGSPRVGNQYFANAYASILQSRTHRWATWGDLVTLFPAATPGPLTGYRHVGLTNNINANGTRTHGTNEFLSSPNGPIIGNHDMWKYVWRMHFGLSSAKKQVLASPAAYGGPAPPAY